LLVAYAIVIGVLVGRRVFTVFAHSLGVVDTASTTLALLLALVVAVALAAVIGAVVAVATSRRGRASAVLREA